MAKVINMGTNVTITGKCNACGASASVSGFGKSGETITLSGSCANGHNVQASHTVR